MLITGQELFQRCKYHPDDRNLSEDYPFAAFTPCRLSYFWLHFLIHEDIVHESTLKKLLAINSLLAHWCIALVALALIVFLILSGA